MINPSATISRTVIRGFNDEIGSWKIICIFLDATNVSLERLIRLAVSILVFSNLISSLAFKLISLAFSFIANFSSGVGVYGGIASTALLNSSFNALILAFNAFCFSLYFALISAFFALTASKSGLLNLFLAARY